VLAGTPFQVERMPCCKRRGDGLEQRLMQDQVALGRRLVDEGTSVRTAAKVRRYHYATLYRALDAAPASG